MILAIEMASRNFSLDEVLSLMEHEEDLEIDDPQVVILGGSDKEFDRHGRHREPRKLYSYLQLYYVSMYYYLLSCRYGL